MAKLLTFSPLDNMKCVFWHWVVAELYMTLYLESTYFKMEIVLRLLFNLLQEPSLILFTILVSPVFYQTNDNLNLIPLLDFSFSEFGW